MQKKQGRLWLLFTCRFKNIKEKHNNRVLHMHTVENVAAIYTEASTTTTVYTDDE